MVKIRNLEIKDAAFMYEWMHDDNVIEFFSNNFKEKTLDDVIDFIKKSNEDSKNLNLAITDDNDEYLGTISLKNIDYKNKNAEYAISLRRTAIGKGISKKATDLILEKAFKEEKLHKVYLCVASDNIRAIKFYEKYGFIYEGTFKEHIYRNNKYFDLHWYAIKGDNYND